MADSRLINTASSRPTCLDQRAADPTGFTSLGLSSVLTEALARAGIVSPFPIQTATLPDALAGRDVLGCGRTGSGKTLAFALPVLSRLAAGPRPATAKRPRALILAPTRELTRQILGVINPLGAKLGLRSTALFGGVPTGPQINALRRGVDIVVACPGRLEDLVRSGAASLADIEITVLDEADHMADLGFLPAVRRLLDRTPPKGQRLLFSATLDTAVDVLVRRYLSDPVTHRVDDDRSPVAEMTHHVLHVASADRLTVLIELASAHHRSIVFTRTKHRARQLTRQLAAAGIPAVEMHGNLTQPARVRNLEAFSTGRATTLVATDIAARGLHIDDVEIVIHADPPVEHKAYLHRSGRTARAGAGGTVITLATENQRAEVAKLSQRARVTPFITRHRNGHPVLDQLSLRPDSGKPPTPGTRSGPRRAIRPGSQTPTVVSPRRKRRRPLSTSDLNVGRRARPSKA